MSIRETFNQVHIEGYLNKKNIEIKNKDGKEFIAGNLEIRIDENNIIPVEIFCNKLKKDNTENSIYKGILTVLNEYKDATEVDDWTKAEKVRVSSGKISVQDFIAQGTNEPATAVKYTTNFVNRVTDSSFEPKATFKLETIVKGFAPEIRNEEETGRGFMDAYLVAYGGEIKPVRFVVEKNMFEKMQDSIESGSTMNIWGNIVSTVDVKTIKDEADFGTDNKQVITSVRKERIISGARYVDEEKAFTKEQLAEAFENREKKLEELKTKKLFEGSKNQQQQQQEEKLPWEE